LNPVSSNYKWTLIFLLVTCKKKEDSNQNQQPTYTIGEGSLGYDGGIVIVGNTSSPIYRASINFPVSAINSTIDLKISHTMGIFLHDDSFAVVFDFTPMNTHFSIPVTIGIPHKQIWTRQN
jgi:hypothetical protein